MRNSGNVRYTFDVHMCIGVPVIQISNDSSHGRMQRKGNTCTLFVNNVPLIIKINAFIRDHLTYYER